MATITKRKNANGTTSYIAQVRRIGYPSITRAFNTKLAAEIWSTGKEEQARNGTLTAADRMTFIDLLAVVEPRLDRPYKAAVEYWRNALGPLRLARITPALLDAHRDQLLGAPCRSHRHKTKRPRSATSVWHYLQQLSRVFSIADEDLHLIEGNPVAKVRRPSLPRGRDRFLTDDELALLLTHCRSSDSKGLYAFALFLVTTGARRGEAYGLHWEHIDVERRWARFPKTKNGTARGVPLTQAVLDELMALPRAGARVFPCDLTKAWRTAVKRAGLADFRLHDLRHSAASRLVRDGASLFEVGRLLGHKDPRMTDRYSHLADEHTKALVDRVMSGVK
jgi:integrase